MTTTNTNDRAVTIGTTTIYSPKALNHEAREAFKTEVRAAGKKLRDFKLIGWYLRVHSHTPTLQVHFKNLRDGFVSVLNVAI